jgi:hypothetical protein
MFSQGVFFAAWTAGHAMDLVRAVDYALEV